MSQVLTADARPHAPRSTAPTKEAALFEAAKALLPVLAAGRPLDKNALRDAMTRAFGATDAEGAWLWKDAYEAAEAAVVLFLKRYGRAMRHRAGAGPEGPAAMLAMLQKLSGLEPSHTKRSEDPGAPAAVLDPARPRLRRAQGRRYPARRRRDGAERRDRDAGRDGRMRARKARARST